MPGDSGPRHSSAPASRGTEAAWATEGAVLLEYALGRAPDTRMVELYVQALGMSSPPPVPLRLPPPTRAMPRLLRLFEPIRVGRPPARPHPFLARLSVASLIANIGFAPVFYDYESAGLCRSVVRLGLVGVTEVAIMPLRLIAGPMWRW